MQDLTELAYTTSPQHKESTEVRIKRNAFDLENSRPILQPAHPTQLILFEKHSQLDSGWTDVNVHAFQEVGNMIIRYITGQSTFVLLI
ncbi:hypothetical protein DPMN_000387 [Dreissena polymorpha]|uniref:Uncharacterized protein n=1 Tax=Dreissena polymorpha TaxID=45954 RepID=A0A9D4RS14_DREPO|nr:hypothetical protein DPMN_000387 [Dreissena polymorpha]